MALAQKGADASTTAVISKRAAKTSDSTGKRSVGLALAALPSLWLGLFLVVPVVLLVLWSLQAPGFAAPLSLPLGLDSYMLNLATPEDWILLIKTILTALIVALVAVILAYPVAYFLALIAGRNRRYIFLVLALLPFLTGYLLRIFAWRLLLGNLGIINYSLETLGIVHHPLDFLLFSRTAVIVVLIYVWVPWAALPMFVRLEQMDRTLLWAAADLGASPLRAFARVTVPLSMAGVYVAFFFVFIPTLGDFATASAVGGASGVMLGNIIQGLLTALIYPSGAVLSVLLLLVALSAMLLGARLMRFEEWVGGVKNL